MSNCVTAGSFQQPILEASTQRVDALRALDRRPHVSADMRGIQRGTDLEGEDQAVFLPPIAGPESLFSPLPALPLQRIEAATRAVRRDTAIYGYRRDFSAASGPPRPDQTTVSSTGHQCCLAESMRVRRHSA